MASTVFADPARGPDAAAPLRDASRAESFVTLDTPQADSLHISLKSFGQESVANSDRQLEAINDLRTALKESGAPAHLIVDVSEMPRIPSQILGSIIRLANELKDESTVHLVGAGSHSKSSIGPLSPSLFTLHENATASLLAIGMPSFDGTAVDSNALSATLQSKLDGRILESARRIEADLASMRQTPVPDGAATLILPHDDYTVVRLQHLSLANKSPGTDEVIAAVREAAQRAPVIVDLSRTDEIGDRVWGALIHASKVNSISICGANPHIRGNIDIMGLDRIFNVVATEAQAVEALQMK